MNHHFTMSSNDSSISLINKIQLLSRYTSISFGFVFFSIGILGSCLNALTFLSVGHYKTNPTSFYMLIKVLFDSTAILIGLPTRILPYGFQIDWTIMSQIVCKLRRYWMTTNNVITFSLLALQSIDIFLCSSPSVSRRQMSSIANSHRIVITIISFSILHSLPFLFYQNIVLLSTGNLFCLTTHEFYNQYQLYFINICLYTVIPVVIIFIFGLLTYRNIHFNNRQHQRRLLCSFTRQMIRMHIYNIIIVIIFVTPYGVIHLYSLLLKNTIKTNIQDAFEQLALRFTTICFYGHYAVS